MSDKFSSLDEIREGLRTAGVLNKAIGAVVIRGGDLGFYIHGLPTNESEKTSFLSGASWLYGNAVFITANPKDGMLRTEGAIKTYEFRSAGAFETVVPMKTSEAKTFKALQSQNPNNLLLFLQGYGASNGSGHKIEGNETLLLLGEGEKVKLIPGDRKKGKTWFLQNIKGRIDGSPY